MPTATTHEQIRDGAVAVRDLLQQASTAITEASERSRSLAAMIDHGNPFERFWHAISTQIRGVNEDLGEDMPIATILREAEDLVALVGLAEQSGGIRKRDEED